VSGLSGGIDAVPPVEWGVAQLCAEETNLLSIASDLVVSALLTHLAQPPIEHRRSALKDRGRGDARRRRARGGSGSLLLLRLCQLLLQLRDERLLLLLLLLCSLLLLCELLQLLLQLLLLSVHGGGREQRNREPGTGLETKCDRRVYATVCF
jgi:hypothetical protein